MILCMPERVSGGGGKFQGFCGGWDKWEGQVFGLERNRVDLKARQIMLYKTKTNRPRPVELNDVAVEALSKLPVHISCTYVFWHGEGQRYVNVASNFQAIKRKTGASFRFHDLRHKFAIEYLKEHPQGIYRLSKILGHASVKTTEIYLAYVDEVPTQKSAQEVSH